MDLIKEFNKRFCDGEQYIDYITQFGEEKIIELEKQYFWQERMTFNHIRPLVDLLQLKCPKITEDDLYGKHGFVSYLIPLQRAYNDLKNRKHELLNRLSMAPLLVEDGSVDTDNLEEEGLMPGKVLIYRQGSTPPSTIEVISGNIDNYNSAERELLDNFNEYYEHFYKLFSEKYKSGNK
jgi:hypothetical protein